jgi:hypothetical protein
MLRATVGLELRMHLIACELCIILEMDGGVTRQAISSHTSAGTSIIRDAVKCDRQDNRAPEIRQPNSFYTQFVLNQSCRSLVTCLQQHEYLSKYLQV